jgi:hypothetical protein
MSLGALPIELKPDENIFSLISRAHILSGSKSPLKTLKTCTTHRGFAPLSSLPTNLLALKENLRIRQPIEILIRNHTLFNLYRPFLTQDRQRFVIDGMKYCGAVKSRMGLLKSHCGANDQLAYCDHCYEDDIYKYGFPYWHREHMLTGTMICYLHRCPLKVLNLSLMPLGRRNLQLPGAVTSIHISATNENKLLFIAEQIADLTHENFISHIGVGSYKALLRECGLLTSCNHVRIKELNRIAQEWLKPLRSVVPYDNLYYALDVERNWVANLVAGKENLHHPLKHIILWGVLCHDCYSILPLINHEAIQMELPLNKKKKFDISKEDIISLQKRFISVTAIAQHLKCSVTTLLVSMNKFGIPHQTKAKKISSETYSQVNFLVSCGRSSREVAQILNLSISSVNRIKRILC